EVDLDGDGRYDLDLAPLVSPVAAEVQRAGTFTVKARVTDSSGVSGTAVAPMTATAIGTRGWLVSPRAGELVWGTSVTLTAESTPAGAPKSVQFQYRRDSPTGPWIDVGGPIVSTSTLFSTAWDVSALPAFAVDLRVLVDGSVSSGDDANTVLPSAVSPTLSESGSVLQAAGPRVVRNGAGVWAFTAVPLRIESAARPFGSGSALGLVPVGGAYRITGGTRVRLPFAGDGSALDVHAYDEAARVWIRLVSRVSHDDGWVEADAIAPAIYALYATPAGDAGGGRFCSAQAARAPGPWIVVFALGLLACCRRR
ncbi:MAG TPA: hypothetical protein VJB14_15570, partial [Planctomycetota bacterium]|nr:hypothetical protein [Planctomycetota bacterium]